MYIVFEKKISHFPFYTDFNRKGSDFRLWYEPKIMTHNFSDNKISSHICFLSSWPSDQRETVKLSSKATPIRPLIMSRGGEKRLETHKLALTVFCIPLCQVQLHKRRVNYIVIVNTDIWTPSKVSPLGLEFLEYHWGKKPWKLGDYVSITHFKKR